MEYVLIKGARHLRRPNTFGIKKIKRNILALQQSIKTLTDDPQDAKFEHVQQYYTLFFITPQVSRTVSFCIDTQLTLFVGNA